MYSRVFICIRMYFDAFTWFMRIHIYSYVFICIHIYIYIIYNIYSVSLCWLPPEIPPGNMSSQCGGHVTKMTTCRGQDSCVEWMLRENLSHLSIRISCILVHSYLICIHMYYAFTTTHLYCHVVFFVHVYLKGLVDYRKQSLTHQSRLYVTSCFSWRFSWSSCVFQVLFMLQSSRCLGLHLL